MVVCDGLTGHVTLCTSPKVSLSSLPGRLRWKVGDFEMRLVGIVMCWKEEIGSCSEVP